MSTNNNGIRNGKSGQTWSLQWVTDSGTREYRKITLTEDVTKAVMLGRKPLKYMKKRVTIIEKWSLQSPLFIKELKKPLLL